MAKRLIDAKLFDDPFFFDLPLKFKALWIYIHLDCNHAGIFKPNMKKVAFMVGQKFEERECLEVFGSRVAPTPKGNWVIRNYIDFQFGGINKKSKIVESAKVLLEKECISYSDNGLDIEYAYPKDRVSLPYNNNNHNNDQKPVTININNVVSNKQEAPIRNEAQWIVDTWNAWASSNGFSQIEKLSEKRRNNVRKLAKNKHFMENFEKVLNKVPNIPFFAGKNDRRWKVNFDYITRNDDNYIKILEQEEDLVSKYL